MPKKPETVRLPPRLVPNFKHPKNPAPITWNERWLGHNLPWSLINQNLVIWNHKDNATNLETIHLIAFTDQEKPEIVFEIDQSSIAGKSRVEGFIDFLGYLVLDAGQLSTQWPDISRLTSGGEGQGNTYRLAIRRQDLPLFCRYGDLIFKLGTRAELGLKEQAQPSSEQLAKSVDALLARARDSSAVAMRYPAPPQPVPPRPNIPSDIDSFMLGLRSSFVLRVAKADVEAIANTSPAPSRVGGDTTPSRRVR